jgi:hypothetical protein
VTTKYDDASWHYEGSFPDDLPDEAAATHIAVFVVWCLLNGHAGEDLEAEILDLEEREVTPGEFLVDELDEVFTSDELDDEGNAFTVAYFEGRDGDSTYVADYLAELGLAAADIYRAPDTWETYDRLAPHLARRRAEWRDAGRPTYLG